MRPGIMYLDPRTGSGDLLPVLAKYVGVGVVCETLEYGDAGWVGNGKDYPMDIGVEIKKLHDVLQCIGDGRFSGHQLPGLLSTYPYVWLMIEGVYRAGPDGILEVRRGKDWVAAGYGARRFMYRDLESWITDIEVVAGVRVKRTSSRQDTAAALVGMFKWWQKDWDDHKACAAIHSSGYGDEAGRVQLVKPGLVRRWAAELPGIGWKRSKEFDRRWATAGAMANASVSDFEELDGVGKKGAVKVYNAINFGE